MSEIYPPGKDNVPVGEYTEVGPRGGKVDNPRNATIDKKGKRLPPTSEEGNKWKRD